MEYPHPPRTFFVILADPADVEKIDQAIAGERLDIRKLGADTYLGFFFDGAEETYGGWKRDFGVSGEVHWIELPTPVVTK
jgi:hypothetical protein